ncbi:MAG: copper chaperone PCu(A)C, partial [Flavobacteriales bacterium]|nr:copper chaperone PCu(A)C [Flavobacteriales bacterium]
MATILITAGAVAALSRAEGTDVGVSESWMRPTLGANRNTAAYATITNNRHSADRLIAASTAGAQAVELHTAGME